MPDPTPAGTGPDAPSEALEAALTEMVAGLAGFDYSCLGAHEADVAIRHAKAEARAAYAAALRAHPAGERGTSHRLAMLALQSQRYQTDMDYRDAVDDVLAWTMPRTPTGGHRA